MFADACDKARNFTRHMVALWCCADGKVKSGVGSLVVVNRDGWFLSAYHNWKMLQGLNGACVQARDHQSKVAAVTSNTGLNKGQRKNALAQLGKLKDDAPTNWAVIWINHGTQVRDVSYIEGADIMLGRLDPFDPASVPEYPTFKDPGSGLRQGTSLVRVGYPFPTVEATYDAAIDGFNITKAELPVFPIEGIFTRNVNVGLNSAGYAERFIETSSPGLKGQSGGPILDTRGVVWGIQSQTRHLSLGFDPPIPKPDGTPSDKKEHQFLNVGWGTHPETILGLLKEKGIDHASSA